MYTSRFFRTILMPAALFQAVLVGPGYGSGREVIEFVTRYGALGGLLAVLVAAAIFAIVLIVTYEMARLFHTFDYRSFFLVLLGKYWFVYEILFAAMLVLVLAVSTSAGARILTDTFGIPHWIGAGMMMAGIVICNFYGRRLVEISLTWGMIAFTTVLLVYVAVVLNRDGSTVMAAVLDGDVKPGWALDGMRFAFYNSFVIPPLLYVAREFQSRREVVRSGLVSAVFSVVPAIIFHLTFIPGLPGILDQQLPTFWTVQSLQIPVLFAAFTIVLFVMIVQTGVGILQGVNERIDAVLIEARGRGFSRSNHALVSLVTVVLSSGLSVFGVIALVAKGYGAMAWGFVVVYLLPLVTRGIWLAFFKPRPAPAM
ncbi:MAG TPA: hypothetical protein VJN01_04030 [Xanthomonadales bacterium]|nr:hypothetical protein [Xanthomonadales bacterium]